MYAIIVAISPFITSVLTGWLKTLPTFTNLSDQARTPAVRALAAVVSLVYIIGGMWITGSFNSGILSGAVTAFIFALLAWLGSLGVFHAFFQKPVQQ